MARQSKIARALGHTGDGRMAQQAAAMDAYWAKREALQKQLDHYIDQSLWRPLTGEAARENERKIAELEQQIAELK